MNFMEREETHGRPRSSVREMTPLEQARRMGLEKVATINGIHYYHVGKEHGWAENPLFEKYHREIYTPAFHPDEAIPLEGFRQIGEAAKAGLVTAGLHGMLAFNKKGEMVGGGSGVYLHGAKAGFVGYNAVAQGLRGGGIGTGLNEAFRRLFIRKHGSLRWMLGESDVLPDPAKPISEETRKKYEEYGNPWDRTRWKAQKLGRQLLVLPGKQDQEGQYRQPAITELEMAETPLRLHVTLYNNGRKPVSSNGFADLVRRRRSETEETYKGRVDERATEESLRLLHAIYSELPPYHMKLSNERTRTRFIAQGLGIRPKELNNVRGFRLASPLTHEFTPEHWEQYRQIMGK